MKKTYISPVVMLHTVELQNQLLAGSAKGSKVYGSNDADQSLDVLSRRHNSVWDDEEDYEDEY